MSGPTIDIKIPGRVWDDALDPMVTGMFEELELPEPRIVKRGKGRTFYLDGVLLDTADELARYLWDRGDMLLGQGVADPYDPWEKRERATYRAACGAGEEILDAVRAARS